MLPREELPHFSNTISWIKSPIENWAPDSLPSVLLAILPASCFVEQPVLDIFLNNKERDMKAPYCTAIVWLYDVAYMFILPLVDIDAGKYKYDENLNSHWLFMSTLTGIHCWQQQDTCNYRLSTPWVEWPIDLALPHIHVLPKTDAVFEKCLSVKPSVPHIEMPEFKGDGIRLNKVLHATFTSLYPHPVTDDDLMDVTIEYERLTMKLNSRNRTVNVRMSVKANDTTNKIPFFKFSYEMVFEVDTFGDYIHLEYSNNGEPTSFAFHYELRDFLLVASLAVAEQALYPQRKGTPFELCSMDRIFTDYRICNTVIYLVPFEDSLRYAVVEDKMIHGITYDETL